MAKLLFINPLMREEDEPRHVPYGMALLAALVVRDGVALFAGPGGVPAVFDHEGVAQVIG